MSDRTAIRMPGQPSSGPLPHLREGVGARVGMFRWGSDARRERVATAGRAPSSRVAQVRLRSAPGVVVHRTPGGRIGLPRLTWFVAGSPRTPREPRYPTASTRVRMPDVTGCVAALSTGLIHETPSRPHLRG